MEQSPSWKADSHSAGQDIHRLKWNPEVHYRIHKSQLLAHILRQMSKSTPTYPIPLTYILVLSPNSDWRVFRLLFRFLHFLSGF